MTDPDKSTIAELAEVIADQNERIREAHQQLDEQNDVIVAYELDQEDDEKVTASLYADLVSLAKDFGTEGGDDLNAIIDCYFDRDDE